MSSTATQIRTRITIFLFIVSLIVFAYEQHYVSQTQETNGKILSIHNKAKGKVITTSFLLDNSQQLTFSSGIGPLTEGERGHPLEGNVDTHGLLSFFSPKAHIRVGLFA